MFYNFGRSDASLNPGGVWISIAEIYRQVDKVEEILEGFVVGQAWQDDTRIVLFVRLGENTILTQDLIKYKQLQDMFLQKSFLLMIF